MGKIAIVYWSGTGNTEAMANFVAEGAGGQADLFTPGEFSAGLISSYSAGLRLPVYGRRAVGRGRI